MSERIGSRFKLLLRATNHGWNLDQAPIGGQHAPSSNFLLDYLIIATRGSTLRFAQLANITLYSKVISIQFRETAIWSSIHPRPLRRHRRSSVNWSPHGRSCRIGHLFSNTGMIWTESTHCIPKHSQLRYFVSFFSWLPSRVVVFRSSSKLGGPKWGRSHTLHVDGRISLPAPFSSLAAGD